MESSAESAQGCPIELGVCVGVGVGWKGGMEDGW